MMKINRAVLRDKIYACWMGKNLGGTLGTPFENTRSVIEVDGMTTPPGKPLPNDDLDLQLVWLLAMADVGPKNINASLLGEYWLEYITPFWAEYGRCKANMRDGLIPPVSGQYRNEEWRNSNGAWIRTEIWATLCPGDIPQAVKFATEDASVDHGRGEGTYAARFVAALESAAFFENDLRTLIQIGLRHVPESSRMFRFVNTVTECFDSGKTWLETRNLITQMALDDPELGWFQAPANVSYALIGLLWGKGDFKESLLIAVRCGDDTDCSAATAGSILGIMYGTAILPEDWCRHIGDEIITCSLATAVLKTYNEVNPREHFMVPYTCTDLTDRVMELIPVTLYGRQVQVVDGESERDEATWNWLREGWGTAELVPDSYEFSAESILAKYTIRYVESPDIAPLEERHIKLRVHHKFLGQKGMKFRWILPEGWTVKGRQSAMLEAVHWWDVNTEFTLTAGETVEAKNVAILQITFEGHHDMALIPVQFMG